MFYAFSFLGPLRPLFYIDVVCSFSSLLGLFRSWSAQCLVLSHDVLVAPSMPSVLVGCSSSLSMLLTTASHRQRLEWVRLALMGLFVPPLHIGIGSSPFLVFSHLPVLRVVGSFFCFRFHVCSGFAGVLTRVCLISSTFVATLRLSRPCCFVCSFACFFRVFCAPLLLVLSTSVPLARPVGVFSVTCYRFCDGKEVVACPREL